MNIKVSVNFEQLTGLCFEERLSADSIQALLEGFEDHAVTFQELVDTIYGYVINERNEVI